MKILVNTAMFPKLQFTFLSWLTMSMRYEVPVTVSVKTDAFWDIPYLYKYNSRMCVWFITS